VLRGLGRVKGGVRAFPLAQSLVAPGSVEVFRSVRSIPPPCVPGDRDYLAPPFRQSASHLSSRPGAACTRVAHFIQFMRCGSNSTLSARGQHLSCPDDVAWAYEGDAEIQGLRRGSCGVRP